MLTLIPQRYRDRTRKLSLKMGMAAAMTVSRLDPDLPTKWKALVDNIVCSASLLSGKLMQVDEEVSRDVIEKEEMLEKRLGYEKFYSEEELERIRSSRDSIEF